LFFILLIYDQVPIEKFLGRLNLRYFSATLDLCDISPKIVVFRAALKKAAEQKKKNG
jgi:hypothetical protein